MKKISRASMPQILRCRPVLRCRPAGAPHRVVAVRPLVVKTTSGADRPEACNQAFMTAASAVAAGARVSLWLSGEATWLALPGRAHLDLEHATPLADLLALVIAEGTVTVCSQCAVRRGIEPGALVPGVRVAGSATFVAETLEPEAQALVY
jgi:predicted peroxiredoxin